MLEISSEVNGVARLLVPVLEIPRGVVVITRSLVPVLEIAYGVEAVARSFVSVLDIPNNNDVVKGPVGTLLDTPKVRVAMVVVPVTGLEISQTKNLPLALHSDIVIANPHDQDLAKPQPSLSGSNS